MKYVYYATLYPDDNQIGVKFYDFPSVNTFGANPLEASEMAKDALEGYLLVAEDVGIKIPEATQPSAIAMADGEILFAIVVDTTLVREREDNKLVKKTLTIPAYVDRAGREADLNFSQLLSETIQKKLELNH